MDDGVRELSSDPRLKSMSQQQQMDLIEFVTGNMLFVGFHELGHAVIQELGLPVLGREEDAADSFATLALLKIGTDFSDNVLVQAARGWFLMDRRDRKEGDMLVFYDAHGLDKQRAYADRVPHGRLQRGPVQGIGRLGADAGLAPGHLRRRLQQCAVFLERRTEAAPARPRSAEIEDRRRL